MSEEQRRLAAIMFTDIVGYTALTQANEANALRLLDAHNRIIRPFLAKYHGIEVKTIGDSFLVEFGSALDALRCAAEVQNAFREHNAASPPNGRIMVRIGIHLGDVIHREGDVFGDAVNISSRLQPLAEPGGICISRQVYDQVRNKFELPIVPLGARTLKNVDSPVEVYSVRMSEEREREHSASDTRRVVVLPFANMSPDPQDEYFADGMTEELISTVSRIDGAEVISRTSVMQYKKSQKPIRQISSELDAGTVLEGSVRKAGNRLRVSVQMIDAARDRHVWAESYDRNMDDVFAIQSDIAGRVAEALKARMAKETPRSAGLTDNVGAYTDYLRGKQILNEGGEGRTKEAIDLLESAVAKDPNFSRAYAELAHAQRHLGMYEDYTKTMKRAEELGRKAIATGPEVAEAHAAMAAAHIALDRFTEARTELEIAVELNPNLSSAHAGLGEIAGAFGNLDESIDRYRKAYVLDPVSIHAGVLLAEVLRASGKVEDALQILSRMNQLYPNNVHVSQGIASCHIQQRNYAEARRVLDEGVRANPGERDFQGMFAILDASEGRRDEAIESLRRISAEGVTPYRNASLFVNAILGNLDGAFSDLDELARIHAWPFLVRSEPSLGPLRRDPRFSDFCRRVGIPPP